MHVIWLSVSVSTALRLILVTVFIGAVPLVAPGCGSDARAVDSCRKIEAARCEQGTKAGCDGLLAGGDVDSCKRFYDVQCGRGVNDSVKEPSSVDLDRCISAIRSSCDVAKEPDKSAACSFLTAQPVDAGADVSLPLDAKSSDDALSTAPDGADGQADGGG
ncbi:MAG: hypothetical protein NVS3B20_07760 [Polyangiales bacterium]